MAHLAFHRHLQLQAAVVRHHHLVAEAGGDHQVGLCQTLRQQPAGAQFAAELLVVGEVQGGSAVRLNNSDLRQRVTEVGVACPRGLARVDDLAAGIADVIDARLGGWCRHAAPARF